MTFEDLKSDYRRQLDDPGFRAENKQRLNLSDRAYAVLLADSEVFRAAGSGMGEGSGLSSHFINHIFRCFRETARSSAALALRGRRMELEALLAPVRPETAREAAVRLLLEGYQSRLADEIRRREEKGIGFSFRLDKENMEYLVSEDGQQESAFYGGRVGRYIKAVLEEYAEHVYVERERICYQAILDEAQLAAANRTLLKLTLYGVDSGKSGAADPLLYVKPLGVRRDSEQLYHYLVGMKAPCKEGPWTPGAIRLTSIKEGKRLKQPAPVSRGEREALEAAIRENGVPYLSGSRSAERIRVRFTPEGERMYHRMLHLRPMYTSVSEGRVYEFCCTLYQAEAYFFKFGHHVKILAPRPLADKFLRRYRSAACQYE